MKKKISPKFIALALLILSFIAAGGVAVNETIAPGEGWGTGDSGTGGGG